MSVLLETARLRLEDWTDAAVDELVTLHADPEVQRYLDANGEGWSREKAEKRLAEWLFEQSELGLGKRQAGPAQRRRVRGARGLFAI